MEARLFDDALEALLQQFDQQMQIALPARIHEQPARALQLSEEFSGRKKMQHFNELLDNLPSGEKPTIMQRSFIDECNKAILALIFGDDFDRHRDSILGEFGMVIYTSMLLAKMSRRVGKSTGMTFFCFCGLMAYDDFSVDMYAYSLSLAQTNVEKVRALVLAMPGTPYRIEYDNRRRFQIRVRNRKTSQYLDALSQANATVRLTSPLCFVCVGFFCCICAASFRR
jgi:hypothetical protein